MTCESSNLSDGADDEARVAPVDARQDVAEADQDPVGDAGSEKKR